MKISYMLVNRSGKGRRIPAGDAWQWIHHVEDAAQMQAVFYKLKKKIRENRLSLANLRLAHRPLGDDFSEMARFEYKGPVIEDDTIAPKESFWCTKNRSISLLNDRFEPNQTLWLRAC